MNELITISVVPENLLCPCCDQPLASSKGNTDKMPEDGLYCKNCDSYMTGTFAVSARALKAKGWCDKHSE